MAVNKTQISARYKAARQVTHNLTFKVEEHIGSIVLEHLSNKFNIHVLDVDLLVQKRPCISAQLKREACGDSYLQSLV